MRGTTPPNWQITTRRASDPGRNAQGTGCEGYAAWPQSSSRHEFVRGAPRADSTRRWRAGGCRGQRMRRTAKASE